jgi:hypothetical protein
MIDVNLFRNVVITVYIATKITSVSVIPNATTKWYTKNNDFMFSS